MAQERIVLKSCRIENAIVKEFLAELIGTFILVLCCDCSIAVQLLSKTPQIDLLAIGVSTGMGLMISFYGAGRISGSHVNPIVTFSLAAIGKFPFWKVFHYFAGQYIGGFLATALTYANYYPAINMYDHGTRSAFYNATSTAGILTSAPSPFLPLGGAALDQVICCALLMLGILCIVDHHNLNTPKPLIPIALFVLLAGLITAFGLNCGPALNPARDVSARILASIVGYGKEVWAPHDYIYWFITGFLAPHFGAFIGTLIYHFGFGLQVIGEDLLFPVPEQVPLTNR